MQWEDVVCPSYSSGYLGSVTNWDRGFSVRIVPTSNPKQNFPRQDSPPPLLPQFPLLESRAIHEFVEVFRILSGGFSAVSG